MAERKVYVGSVGPFLYDDDVLLGDVDGDFEGQYYNGLVTDGQFVVTGEPVSDYNLIRLMDLAARILAPVSVTSLDDPSTELNVLSGTAGAIRVAYQVGDSTNEYTIYAWDTATSESENVPYTVDGDGGMWVAVGGKYNNSYFQSTRVRMSLLGDSTYKTLQDWMNTTQSAGVISGGTVTDGGSGTVDISLGKGFIKTTDSEVGETKFFDWNAFSGVTLTDNNTNFVYISYNSGTPSAASTTSLDDVSFNDEFVVAIVYRSGTTVYILEVSSPRANLAYALMMREYELRHFERASGLVVSETGARYLSMTSGVFYALMKRIVIGSIDTSGTDTFTTYYRASPSGWTVTTGQTQISNVNYDDGDGTLGTVLPNQYGVHWVFLSFDGNLHVVYGQDSYKLAEANEAVLSSELPEFINSFCMAVAKIIVERDATNFTSITTLFDGVSDGGLTAVNHNDLGNLQGGTTDEYYHLTNAELTKLRNL